MHTKFYRWLSFLLLASMLLSSGLNPASAQTAAPLPLTTKVLISAGEVATLNELAAAGSALLADYGAFSLWRVSEAQAQDLKDRPGVNIPPEMDQIGLRGSFIDTRPGASAPEVPAELQQTRTDAEQFWLVQFVGPIKDEWLAALDKTGLQRVIYMATNAYVVWGNGQALAQLDQLAAESAFIQWTGPYHPAYRLDPTLQKMAANPGDETSVQVTIQFYQTAAVAQSVARLAALGSNLLVDPWQVLDFTNVSLELPVNQLAAVANWPDVFDVEPYYPPERLDEAQGQILAGNITTSGGNIVPSGPGYLAWLATKGFPTTPASYPIVAVADDGIDNGTVTPLHPDFYELGSTSNPDRLIFNLNCTSDATANGMDGHGNINASIVAGYNNSVGYPNEDANGYQYGLGISPYGRVAGAKIFANGGVWSLAKCSNTITNLVQQIYNNGGQMTSNSWGSSVSGAYTVDSQAYDSLTRDAASAAGNQQMLHIFSAGNAGSAAQTVGAPGTAKNVITVGATENVRDEGVTDGCGISAANNADDIATFSSRGPTTDSRFKPDLMAPGTHVQGAASQDPGYNGSGVCGGTVAPTRYYPPSPAQSLYTWSTGTSHSAPAVSGAASLLWEYYGRVLNPGQTPNPAMLKALMVNTPRYLNGSGTGGTLPSNNQGWGDVNLGTLFDGNPRLLVDQTQILTATGNTYQGLGSVSSSSLPFQVSLVWTDPAGPTSGNSYINNLDLEVTVGGNTYRGNVFSGAYSATGGTADVRNNTENVFIPAGVSGAFTVRVIATNIAGDGVPGNGDTTDQDFALVIYNGVQIPDFDLDATPATQNVCAPANGTINVSLTSVLGFANPVTLSASGNPAGTTTGFSANPVTPPGASLLTIGNTGSGAPGSYTVRVTGVSGALTHYRDVGLNLFTAAPAAPTLTTPANGAKGVSPLPTFTWSAVPQATTYSIQVATDAGFTSVVASATGLTGTSYTPGMVLASNVLFYWRVWADNGCGTGANSATFAFVTANLATISFCSTPNVAIPDGNLTGVSNDQVLSAAGTLVDLNVSVRATHTWVGDLSFTVRNVGTGTSVTVINQPGVPASTYGCSQNHVNATLDDEASLPVENQSATSAGATPPPYAIDGTFTPNNPLSAFDGQALANTWRMTAVDSVGGDTGTLTQWCLITTYGAANGPVAYADPVDATCGGNAPCFSGGSAIQNALNFVTSGGQVNVLGSHTVNSSLTCVGNVTVAGAAGSSLTWGGGVGNLFTAFDCNLTVKGLAINGGSTANVFNAVGTGSVTAYANNFSNFASAYAGSGSPLLGHNYWGTKSFSAPAPSGMPAGEWLKRLGAPVATWAEGTGSAALGSATLGGGGGSAVIVSFGRGAANAPFDNGAAGHVEAMCSEFYDYFTVGGSGTWTLNLPVDAAPAGCVTNALNTNKLFKITDVTQCAPANLTCWDAVAGTTHAGANLVVTGLTVGDLDGTHFVAGDSLGDDPTVVTLRSLDGRAGRPWISWLVIAAGVFTLGGWLVYRRRSRS